MQPSDSASNQLRPSGERGAPFGRRSLLPLLVVLAVFPGRRDPALERGDRARGLCPPPPRPAAAVFARAGPEYASRSSFLALAAAAFLPARWFTIPAWRIALTKDLGRSAPRHRLSVNPG